jgi:hypothetical protein
MSFTEKLPITNVTRIVADLKDLNMIPMEFIENSLVVATVAFINNEYIPKDSKLSNAYFVGASLCMDVYNHNEELTVIVLDQSTGTFNLFNDQSGFRRNLSIKAMKLLENLMTECNINFKPKYS